MTVVEARTGLVVAIPEAEPVVGAHRLRLDPSAALGAPAHVTVLFPFLPSEEVDVQALDRVAAAVGPIPAFGYRFAHTDWFDDRVLWLAPENPRPFRELTGRVCAEFPEHPPYGGAFPDAVPHLTVGDQQPRGILVAAEREIRPHLPVTGTATEVVLLAQTEPGGRWSRRAAFPLEAIRR